MRTKSGDVKYDEFVEQAWKMKSTDDHTLLIFIKHDIHQFKSLMSEQVQSIREQVLGLSNSLVPLGALQQLGAVQRSARSDFQREDISNWRDSPMCSEFLPLSPFAKPQLEQKPVVVESGTAALPVDAGVWSNASTDTGCCSLQKAKPIQLLPRPCQGPEVLVPLGADGVPAAVRHRQT